MENGEEYRIIWDYDGTILPIIASTAMFKGSNNPYDSEQFLLDYIGKSRDFPISFIKKLVSRAVIYGDQKELLGHSFKKYYNWILRGLDSTVLEPVVQALSELIPDENIETLLFCAEKGFKMSLVSCGTGNLNLASLEKRGVANLFDSCASNFFTFKDGKFSGMERNILRGIDKVYYAEKMGWDREKTIAVGDGYTDIPILDWAACPILLDPAKTKRKKLWKKKYHFIDSLPQVIDILKGWN